MKLNIKTFSILTQVSGTLKNRLHPVTNNGFSLLEVLVTLGITTIGIFTMMTIQTTEIKRLSNNRLMSSRDSLKALTDRYIIDTKVVAQSGNPTIYQAYGSNLNGNIALNYCLNGPPTAATPQCPASDFPNKCCKAVMEQPFLLLDPSDTTHLTVFSGTDQATNPKAPTDYAPARYNQDGIRCDATSDQCSIELVTTFNATCGGGTTECYKADQVFISYSLRQAPGVNPPGGTPMKAQGPASPVLIASAAMSGAGGPAPVLRVTRASMVSSPKPNISDLDTLCTNEFGTDYQLAKNTDAEVNTNGYTVQRVFVTNTNLTTGTLETHCQNGAVGCNGNYLSALCIRKN